MKTKRRKILLACNHVLIMSPETKVHSQSLFCPQCQQSQNIRSNVISWEPGSFAEAELRSLITDFFHKCGACLTEWNDLDALIKYGMSCCTQSFLEGDDGS